MPPKKGNVPMHNITIYIPDIYDANIKKLITDKITPSRSEAIRTAIREFFHEEYKRMVLLGCFKQL